MINGYKKTQIGILPLEWDVCELGEIGEFKNGINKGKEDFGHGFPMVNLKDVFGVSTVKNENLGLVNSTINERKDYFLAKGDVLFIRSSVKPSGVGLTAVIPYDLIDTVYSGFIIRFRDKDILDVNFKKHCFYEIGFRNRLLAKSSVSANTNINQKSLNSLPIGIPPLPEQQKIAEILSTVDDKIEVIDQQIIETQALKKGLMQRLLTKGIGHTEFKDSPLGMIPMSWELANVGDVCKLKGGFAFKSSDSCEKGIRWVKIANVGVNRIKWDDESFLPLGFETKHTEFVLDEGDIVIAMTRPILSGKLKIAMITNTDSGSLLNQRVGRIVHEDTISKEFIYQYFNSASFIEAMEKELMGTDPPNISSSMFEALCITVPSKDEQSKISIILGSVDEKLEVLSEKKNHYQKLKQGLMQQLLTGKIRVKV